MPGAICNMLERGLSRIETLLGSPVAVWHNESLACSPSSLERGVIVEIGGNPVEILFSLIMRLGLFVTADSMIITADDNTITADSYLPVPKPWQLISFEGVDYLIAQVKLSPDKSHLKLHLVDKGSARR